MQKDTQRIIAMLDAMEDGIMLVNRNLTIEHMNRAMIALFGDGVKQTCYQALNHRDNICPWCKAPEVFDQGRTIRREGYQAQIDKTFAVTEKPLKTPDGKTWKLTIYRDITTVKEREKELSESEKDYKRLFEHIACGAFISSKEGKFMDANPALLEMLGYESKEEFLKIDITKDLYFKPEDRRRFRELIERDGRVIDYEVFFKRKDGTPVPVLLTGHVRYDEMGNILGYEGLNVDISRRKRMQRELEKTRIQLLQAEKTASLGKLAAGVAHQLNNPLGGITLYSKIILEEYDLEEGAKEDLERILRDAKRCRDTVKELLEFSRQTNCFMQPCEINQSISRTLFLLENQPAFQNIDLIKDLALSLPAVNADVQQLNHLFMNIILNAADAMEGEGKLTIKSRLLPKVDQICVEISDTGHGIPDDIMPHIFEPFFTTKDEGKGTGLGLSLANSIVENHRGSLKATSKPGKGTTFIIELPIETQDTEGDENVE
jgi:PAS domain S-box-containing protein